MLDDKPPSCTKATGDSIQSHGSDRLPHGTVHSDDAWSREMVYVLVAPGSKFALGLHNSTLIR